MKLLRRTLKLAALLLLMSVLILSCGKRGTGNRQAFLQDSRLPNSQLTNSFPEFIILHQALAELRALDTHQGADKELFNSLKAQLEMMLIARDVDKYPSAPPSGGPENTIDVLARPTSLGWNEARWGDWNNDGQVSAQDLSPLAFNFGKNDNPGDPNYYKYAGYVDGSGDHTVNAGDLTPIAFHFGESTGGYNIYEANDSSGAGSVKVAEIARPPVQQDNENPPTNLSFATLQYDTSAGQIEPAGWMPTPGKWYQVVPHDRDGVESTDVKSNWVSSGAFFPVPNVIWMSAQRGANASEIVVTVWAWKVTDSFAVDSPIIFDETKVRVAPPPTLDSSVGIKANYAGGLWPATRVDGSTSGFLPPNIFEITVGAQGPPGPENVAQGEASGMVCQVTFTKQDGATGDVIFVFDTSIDPQGAAKTRYLDADQQLIEFTGGTIGVTYTLP